MRAARQGGQRAGGQRAGGGRLPRYPLFDVK